jgi:hypothetical protein
LDVGVADPAWPPARRLLAVVGTNSLASITLSARVSRGAPACEAYLGAAMVPTPLNANGSTFECCLRHVTATGATPTLSPQTVAAVHLQLSGQLAGVYGHSQLAPNSPDTYGLEEPKDTLSRFCQCH